jgi:hypothetical protein
VTAQDIAHGAVEGVGPRELRPFWNGKIVSAGGFTKASGNQALAEGWADAIAFGVPFLANPDLPARFRTGAALNAADEASIRSLDFVKTARTMQPRQWNLTASNKAALMGVFGRMLVTPKQLWGSFRPSIRPTSCQLVATTYNLKNPLSHLVGGGRELWKGQLSLQPYQGKAGRRLHSSNGFEDANPCIGSQSYQLCNYNVFGLGSG